MNFSIGFSMNFSGGCRVYFFRVWAEKKIHEKQGVQKFLLVCSLDKDNEARRPLKFRDQARAIREAQGTAAYVNNVGKIVFPVVLIVFTTFYFVLSLI